MSRCKCARQMYRNNHDGTRDYKIVGKASCTKCQGYGHITKCTACDGCGLIKGDRCPFCCGQGVTALKAVTR